MVPGPIGAAASRSMVPPVRSRKKPRAPKPMAKNMKKIPMAGA